MSNLSHRPVARTVADRWYQPHVDGKDALERLAYRSTLLGADRSVANYGGGNTSSKVRERDHLGRDTTTLYVKGSGSDLATMTPAGFAGFRLDELTPLMNRDELNDADMVAYLGRCQVDPTMPRGSIETLLHAFIPAPCVDHTHPDAINMICCSADGERLARECFGDQAIWIPYLRPGFALPKQVAQAVRDNPNATMVLLAKHGLVTWADDDRTVYERTRAAINTAVGFVNDRVPDEPFGGRAVAPLPDAAAREALIRLLPILRGELMRPIEGHDAAHDDGRLVLSHKILTVDRSPAALEFACGATSRELSQVGAPCPDHLIHTKPRPLWLDVDLSETDAKALAAAVGEAVGAYRRAYQHYHERYDDPEGPESAPLADPNPRVIILPGIGVVSSGSTRRAADLARDLYQRAIAVMHGASGIDDFVSLSDAESHAVEYWPLERYKLSLAPPPPELAGRVALITGGGGGIGRAMGQQLSQAGACIIAMDLDGATASDAVHGLERSGLGVAADVTDEAAVVRAFEETVLTFGGVDIVIANAGTASSAPIDETTVAEWDRNQNVLGKGYFLTSREAFRVLRRQGTGGALVFIASKNSVYAGRNAAAYSSAKAAELHLARCLAEEGGPDRIRVNVVNPDAVLRGSRIWQSGWRAERAAAYGLDPDDLEAHYRARTTLGVNIWPEDIAEAVEFLVSDRSAKTTGNMINVDGGVPAAFPR